MSEQTDILIVGGGLIGTSLAIALDAAGRKVTLIEAAAPPTDAKPPRDERNLALARASVNALRALGVWSHVAGGAAAPIRRIHISRAGTFGATRLDARHAGVDALGWTIPASRLGAALQARLDACTTLVRHAPATVDGVIGDSGGWCAHVHDDAGERKIHARLLVGADGAGSMVRKSLGIDTDSYDYQQTLFVATVKPERPLAGCAYERFADAGPVALLPLAGGLAGAVLTVAADQADQVAALDDEAFAALAQQRFGWRRGRLARPGRRFRHPIRRVAAQALTTPRAVLVGNAAQTVHPVGAQGFNLGLRDALTLAELIAAADDPGAAPLLDEYVRRRVPDREAVMAMSHGLIRLACVDQPWLAPLHSLGLLAFDRYRPLRRTMLRGGMGFGGRPPRQVLEPRP
jgi:2-octaprenyl-6-methoxyphenol hydroxylase